MSNPIIDGHNAISQVVTFYTGVLQTATAELGQAHKAVAQMAARVKELETALAVATEKPPTAMPTEGEFQP